MVHPQTGNAERDAPVRVECFMLCDFAREENEKLYIIGGGWDRLTPTELPTSAQFYLGIKFLADRRNAPGPLTLRVEISDNRGRELGEAGILSFEIDDSEQPRDPHAVPIVLALNGYFEIQEAGTYSAYLVINDQRVAKTQFAVDEPNDGQTDLVEA
jgi:hypothetical protein